MGITKGAKARSARSDFFGRSSGAESLLKWYTSGMNRIDRTKTTVTRLDTTDDDSLLRTTTAAERIEMVWEVSISAFAFAGKDASSRLLRHVGNVVRLHRAYRH